jgi:hypothetical protein
MLDERFGEMINATHGAIQTAYIKRKEHAESPDENMQRLSKTVDDLFKIDSKNLALNYNQCVHLWRFP